MTDSDSLLGPPRGMRDFYPEDLLLRSAIFSAWRQAARQSAFQEYDSCVVESLDILKRKGGEEIVDQIYAFSDKSGRALALRPEMTPTLARMVSARKGSLQFPIKWFTIAQCFRYERMSKGRKREHYQWNLDIVGDEDVSAEAEVVSTAVAALTLMGLSPADFKIHLNSRALLADLMTRQGIPPASHAAVFLILDKIAKIEQSQVLTMLHETGLDATSMDRILSIMRVQSLDDVALLLGDVTPAFTQVQRLFSLFENYGIHDAVKFDIAVVRGLNYYTGVVFEAFDSKHESRAIFGGGRYDNLLAQFGGGNLTAVGLGFGDVVIADLLAESSKIPTGQASLDTAVGFMTEEQRTVAISLGAALRKKGELVDLALRPEKAKAFFARTGRGHIRQAIYVGPDDVSKATVAIKNLITRAVTEVPINQIAGTP